MKRLNTLVIGVLQLAFVYALHNPSPAPAASQSARCPTGMRGSLVYAGRNGLVLCRTGSAALLITTRSDATSIQFSNHGREVRFHAGRYDYAYDIRTHGLRSIKRDSGTCPPALLMCRHAVQTPDRRWRLRIIEDPPRAGGMPGGATLAATGSHFTLRVHSANADDLDFAAIAPDSSAVLFWVDFDHSASMMADTVPLGIIRLSAVRQDTSVHLRDDSPDGFSSDAPHIVGPSGVNGYPLREWIAFPRASAEYVAITGEVREIVYSERLARCPAHPSECALWNHKRGFVELDPAWSPDGKNVAFVRAQERGRGDAPSSESAWRQWNGTRVLVIASGNDGTAKQIASAGFGVSWPTWIAASRLLYVVNDQLRLIDLDSGNVTTVADLAPRGIGYYGYVARSDRFSWTDEQ